MKALPILLTALTLIYSMPLYGDVFASSPYQPAVEIISKPSNDYETPSPKGFLVKQSDPDFFNSFGLCFEHAYKPLKKQGFIVSSVKKNHVSDALHNYASFIDQVLEINTQDYKKFLKKTVLTKLDGNQINIDKISTTDADAVFTKGSSGMVRVELSELTFESKMLAREIIKNVLFDKKVQLSVDDDYDKAKEWKGIDGKDSGSIFSHRSYTFDVEIDNKSDVLLDNIIMEYQVFFQQSIEGTPTKANNYYRHVGYLPINVLKGKQLITITPPSLSSSEYREKKEKYRTSTGILIESVPTPRYPEGFHQENRGRMQGIWVRLHRITPCGHVLREYKKNIYPKKAKWDEINTAIGFFDF